MSDPSFARMTIMDCSTERTDLTSGFTPELFDLRCTPKAPVDSETRLRLQISTPVVLWEVHLQGEPDIRAGDKLVLEDLKYPVKTVEPYVWLPTGDTRVRLILEDAKN